MGSRRLGQEAHGGARSVIDVDMGRPGSTGTASSEAARSGLELPHVLRELFRVAMNIDHRSSQTLVIQRPLDIGDRGSIPE